MKEFNTKISKLRINPIVILGFKICYCEIKDKKRKPGKKDYQILEKSNHCLKFVIGTLIQINKSFFPFS